MQKFPICFQTIEKKAFYWEKTGRKLQKYCKMEEKKVPGVPYKKGYDPRRNLKGRPKKLPSSYIEGKKKLRALQKNNL